MHDVLGHVVIAPGDEDLLAKNPVVVVFGDGPRSDRRQIRTSLRFGQVHRARPLAADEPWQIAGLQLVGAVRFDRLHRPGGEQRAQREGHVGRVPHLDRRGSQKPRQPLPAIFGIAAETVPAIADELAVGRAKALGGDDAVLGQGGAALVAELVERREHLAGELRRLLEHHRRQLRGRFLIAGQGGQALQVRQFVDYERHVADGGTIRRHRPLLIS